MLFLGCGFYNLRVSSYRAFAALSDTTGGLQCPSCVQLQLQHSLSPLRLAWLSYLSPASQIVARDLGQARDLVQARGQVLMADVAAVEVAGAAATPVSTGAAAVAAVEMAVAVPTAAAAAVAAAVQVSAQGMTAPVTTVADLGLAAVAPRVRHQQAPPRRVQHHQARSRRIQSHRAPIQTANIASVAHAVQ